MEKPLGDIVEIYRHEFKSPIGRLTLLSTGKGLCYIGFPGDEGSGFISKNFGGEEINIGGKINQEAEKQITAYLNGRLRKFTIKLDLKADGFNRLVLQEVNAIPYGKTRTYGEIARALDNPKAARAVGNANRLNLIPIIIPCHRVVASSGLGGYGGGLPLKEKLLRMEGIDLS
jgi:methylated-DNA-[protein]-cysteine S-methyltransferase